MSYIPNHESVKAGKVSPSSPKMLMRESAMAEGVLETRQVYKLLQLVKQRNTEQIERLLDLGVPGLINLTEPEEGTGALHLVSLDNDVTMARFLLSLGAHLDIQDKKGRTAMMLAAMPGYVGMAEFLANNRANISLVDKEGKGLLFYAIAPTEMHRQIMEMALNLNVDVNNTSHAGKAVFMAACEQAKECEGLCMRLLERGTDPNVADPVTGHTALMAAVSAGSVELVRAILQRGVDPNTVDKNRLHAVYIAATKGFFEVLRLLSAYSADFNLTSTHNNTALHAAASEGHAICCRFLLQRGCSMTKNLQGLLPSQVAKKNGHKAALKELRDAERALNAKTPTFSNEARLHDWSFEHKAVLRQAFQAAEAAVSPVEAVTNETFVSVLKAHGVPMSDESLEVVVTKLEKWGKININDFFAGSLFLPGKFQLSSYKSLPGNAGQSKSLTETTPISLDQPRVDESKESLSSFRLKEMYINLNYCVKRNDVESLRLAFSQNVPVDDRDRYYKTPLMTACMKGNYEMAQFLISQGANVNAYDQFKWTSLHYACLEGHADIVSLLLDHGAVINCATTNGVTPLMRAIESCKPKCVDQLVNAGADVEAANKRGQDCLTLAQLCGSKQICLMIEMRLESATLRNAGEKTAPAPRGKNGTGTKKPPSTKQTPRASKGRCVIALNPNATTHCITLPPVGEVKVASTPRLKQRVADRKIRFAKEDMMKISDNRTQ